MANHIPGFFLTESELVYLARRFATNQVTALAIMRAESGGKTNAYRPASANPSGGADRGTWQFNSDAFPDITDARAYGPIQSTKEAQRVSGNGADFGPWAVGPNSYRGTPRTDLDLVSATAMLSRNDNNQATARMLDLEKALGNASGVGPGDIIANPADAIGLAADAVSNPFSSLVGYLGRMLSLLTSPEFWRRTGLVTAGVAIIAVALIVIFRDTIAPAVAVVESTP